jgi:hypothetical protein
MDNLWLHIYIYTTMQSLSDRVHSTVVDAAIIAGALLSLVALSAAILVLMPRCTPTAPGFAIGKAMLLAGCPNDRSSTEPSALRITPQ